MRRRHFIASSAALPVAGLTSAPAAAAAAPPSAAVQAAEGLFDRFWQAQMARYPEWATFLGDHRYGDRLFDASPAAEAADFAAARGLRAEALALREAGLPPAEAQSLEILVHQLDEHLALEPFEGYRRMTLGARSGLHGDFADLMLNAPVDTEDQVAQLMARLRAFPRRMDQELDGLRRARELRWVPPRPVLQRALEQIDRMLALPLAQSPFTEPFRRLPAGWTPAQREAWRLQGEAAVSAHVLPQVRRLRAFLVDELLPVAGGEGGLSGYPDGEAVYAQRVREHTTTRLTPREIHAIGLRELERLRAGMEAVRRDMGFDGGFDAFVRHLNTDPRYFLGSGEALLAAYRDITKRVDGELPRLFARLPRAPYGVRAMPAHFGEDYADYYEPPDAEVTRAGWFNVNAQGFRRQPAWSMETTAAHEAVPGHHLQQAHALEQGELPRFRRSTGFTAYDEGWALYAETLGFELGLYRSPESRFGHLQWQAFRAARLVVDTGLHALGWTRQRAVDYMVERTGESPALVASEVDRYLSWPGQALAYTIGRLRIEELRDAARLQMGSRFDLRQFHQVVLDEGSVPLPLLETAVGRWAGVRKAA